MDLLAAVLRVGVAIIGSILAISVLGSLPLLLIWLKRKLVQTFAHAAEARAFNRPWLAGSEHFRYLPGKYFPFASISTLLVIVLLVSLSGVANEPLGRIRIYLQSVHDWGFVAFVSSMAQWPALLILPFAFYLHYSGGNRRWKYELILTSLVAAAICQGYFQSGIQGWGGSLTPAIAVGIGIGLLFWWFLFVIAQFIAPLLIERAANRGHLHRWFYFWRAPVWWILAFLSLPLFVLYCLQRYHLVGIAARHPILYFRSFNLVNASTVFREVVVKGARRHGVVEGLISAHQRGVDLQAAVELVDNAHFFVSDNEGWNQWVETRLPAASAVIIDATDAGGGVLWELRAAVSVLGSGRVVVLFRGAPPSLPSEIWRIGYDSSTLGLTRARKELSAWLKRTVTRPSGNQADDRSSTP